MQQDVNQTAAEQNQNANQEQEQINGQTSEQPNGQAQENEPELTEEEKLNLELEKCQDKIKDLENQMLYKAAEFDNYRKRTIKERADLIKTACADVVTSLLPVIDDFERAIAYEQNNATDNKSFQEGMELIYKNLLGALTARGLKVIETKDQDFNTDMHEAIAMVPAPAPEQKGKILDCTRKGYMLNDKVLRFAQVVVAQ